MVDLDEFKLFIKYTKPGATDDDADLASILTASVEHVESMCGALVVGTIVDETAEARNGFLILSEPPASVTEVTAAGAPLDVTGWTPTSFGFAGVRYSGFVRVTYTVGAAVMPDWARLAVLNWGKYLWQARLGPRDAAKAADYRRTAEALMSPHLIHPRI